MTVNLAEDSTGRLVAALVCVLLLTVLLGAAARRVGQPPVVGEMFGGIVVGPILLAMAGAGQDGPVLNPLTQGQLSALGAVGLIFYVLLMGAEIDHAVLRRQRRSVLATATAAFVVPLIGGVALGLVLVAAGFGSGPRSNPVAASLFVGVCLSVTALPVLGRIVEERGLSGSRPAQVAMTAAAANDALAWGALGLTLMLVPHGSGPVAVARALGAVLLVLTMLGPVARLLRHLLVHRRGYARPWAPPLILLGALACAWLSNGVGLHSAFGAIIFGLALPRVRGAVPAAPLAAPRAVAAVLLPVFFVSAGLSVDLGALGGTGLVSLAATVVVAVAAKTLGAGLCARWAGLSRRDARTVGLLMNARGVTELVAVNVGYQAGLIDQGLYTVLVMMALATTVTTGALVRRAGKPAARPGAEAASVSEPGPSGTEPGRPAVPAGPGRGLEPAALRGLHAELETR
jgi:Kef-type K+ transport system membrane component KefB